MVSSATQALYSRRNRKMVCGAGEVLAGLSGGGAECIPRSSKKRAGPMLARLSRGVRGVRTQMATSIDVWAVSRVLDRKSTRLNSSHLVISYAVFCLKKKTPMSHPTNIAGTVRLDQQHQTGR